MIRPCGFCKSKASTIFSLTRWYQGYGFDQAAVRAIPQDRLRGELLALRGIGPETADVILTYAFYKPAFIVDAYTRRLLQRLGYRFPDDGAIRGFFAQGLPRDAEVCGYLHWLILDHGIQHCKKAPELLAEIGADDAFVHAVCSHGYGLCSDVEPVLEIGKVIICRGRADGPCRRGRADAPLEERAGYGAFQPEEKFKDKKFAAGCSRDVIRQGAERLGWELDRLLDSTLQAMRACEDDIAAQMASL